MKTNSIFRGKLSFIAPVNNHLCSQINTDDTWIYWGKKQDRPACLGTRGV